MHLLELLPGGHLNIHVFIQGFHAVKPAGYCKPPFYQSILLTGIRRITKTEFNLYVLGAEAYF